MSNGLVMHLAPYETVRENNLKKNVYVAKFSLPEDGHNDWCVNVVLWDKPDLQVANLRFAIETHAPASISSYKINKRAVSFLRSSKVDFSVLHCNLDWLSY